VTNNDLSIQANYEFVADQIDIDNYITYQVAQIYLDNTDWPGNNVKLWNSPETKWRWILYDTDFSFGRPWEAPPFYDNDTLSYSLEANGPGWPNPPWSTLLTRKLMENTEFRVKFINRFADESNTRFKADSVRQHVEAIAASVAAEIPQHFAYWSDEENRSVYWQNQFMLSTYEEWVAEVDKITEFTDNRIPFLTDHFKNYFNIVDTHTLTLEINNTEAGSVQLNSLILAGSSWQGTYYDNIPISIEAKANEGYVFSHWDGVSAESSAVLTISMTDDITIQAVFIAQ
jgi:spore coat protein CotH